ncbi:MAG: hypothetical protein PUE58_02590 [Lachnospiraceae bacterium]|nr:hypothetical protein [Lachnospiraceae bacterium]
MRKRFLIALLVFVLFVVCKLSFSSIGAWHGFIGEGVDSTVLGKARSIRSDEWMVTTPFRFTQRSEGFPLVNSNLNCGNNDMTIYGAPVADLKIIVQPQYWGYFLGNDYGLSWYWIFKVLFYLLVSFDLGMILTKGDQILSFAASFWLLCSPALMWWSMNDAMVYGPGMIVAFHEFVSEDQKSWKKKVFLAYLMCVSSCNFAFSLYPAWLIPMAYLIISFLILDFVKAFRRLRKSDYLIIMVTFVFILLEFACFFYESRDAIRASMATLYPGRRFENGGGYQLSSLLNDLFCLFTPYSDYIKNPCEMAAYIAPYTSILFVLVYFLVRQIRAKSIKHEKLRFENRGYFWILLGIITIFLLRLFFVWPHVLSKISLLYVAPMGRLVVVFGYGVVLLTLVLAANLSHGQKLNHYFVLGAVAFTIGIDFLVIRANEFYPAASKKMVLIMLTAAALLSLSFLSGRKHLFALIILLLSLGSSAVINPLTQGTASLTGTDIAKKARQIAAEDKDAVWIGATDVNAQYLVANGIKTLNGINEWPNYDWIDKIDPGHSYEKVWNRYAHISIVLGTSTSFGLYQQDVYILQLSPSDLRKMGATYIYTFSPYDDATIASNHLKLLYQGKNSRNYIYKVE